MGGSIGQVPMSYVTGSVSNGGDAYRRNAQTTTYSSDGRLVTSIGAFQAGVAEESGYRSTLASGTLVETVDRGQRFSPTGELTKPLAYFESTKAGIGYGAKLDVDNLTGSQPASVTAAIGHERTWGGTPGRDVGTDAFSFSQEGSLASVSYDAPDGVLANLSTKYTIGSYSSKSGFGLTAGPNYDLSYKRQVMGEEGTFGVRLNSDTTLIGGVKATQTNQQVGFTYNLGMPAFFPDKAVSANLWQIKAGVKFDQIPAGQSLEIATIAYGGKEIPSLLSVPVQFGPKSMGFSVKWVLDNGHEIEVNYSRRESKGNGSYFVANDLNEAMKTMELNAKVKLGRVSVKAGYEQIQAQGSWAVASPTTKILLSTFPDGANGQGFGTATNRAQRLSAGVEVGVGDLFNMEKPDDLTAGVDVTLTKDRVNQYGLPGRLNDVTTQGHISVKF